MQKFIEARVSSYPQLFPNIDGAYDLPELVEETRRQGKKWLLAITEKTNIVLLVDIENDTMDIINYGRAIKERFGLYAQELKDSIVLKEYFEINFGTAKPLSLYMFYVDLRIISGMSYDEAIETIKTMSVEEIYDKYKDFEPRRFVRTVKNLPKYKLWSETKSFEQDEMRGILMCHGHIHMPKGLPKICGERLLHVRWLLVDIDPSTQPDIVASYDDPEKLGKAGWNVIVSMACPLNPNMTDNQKLFTAANYLLNSGGLFIIPASRLEKFNVMRAKRVAEIAANYGFYMSPLDDYPGDIILTKY